MFRGVRTMVFLTKAETEEIIDLTPFPIIYIDINKDIHGCAAICTAIV